MNSNYNSRQRVHGVAPFDAADTEPWPSGTAGYWAITVHVGERLYRSIPHSSQEALVYLCDDRAELDLDRHTRRFRQVLPDGSVAVVLFRLPRIRSWGRPMWVVLCNDRRHSHGMQWWFAHRRGAHAHYEAFIAHLTNVGQEVAR